MSVTLTGTGGLFTRLGKIRKLLGTLQGATAETLAVGSVDDAGAVWGSGGATVNDLKTAYNAIDAQYQSTLQHLVDSLYASQTSLRTAIGGQLTTIANLVGTTLIAQVDADATLPVKDVKSAAKELIRQMNVSVDTIDANAVSVSVAAASGNTGNSTVIATVKGPGGKNREYIYSEVMELIVTADGGTGGTAGSEACSLKGEAAESSMLRFNWPDGSGASTTTAIADPSIDATTNQLTNGDFEDWSGVPESSANVPSRFAKLIGVIGTDIKKTTVAANLYSSRTNSVAALEFVGDGATLTSIAQTFNDAVTGTSKRLAPNTVYGFCIFVKRSAAIAAGVLSIDLVDGTNTVINDDAGTANTISKTLSALGASYEAVSGFFITPKVVPTTHKLRIRLSTALEAGKSIYLDDACLVVAKQAYDRGPYIAAFRGSTDAAKDDQWNITVSNDYGGTFQTYVAWAILNLPSLVSTGEADIQIPSHTSAGETISDGLCF